ncbi:alanine racemase [Alcaligenes endophyticus]|uniref:Alanine racemase n=1 Tax=Alcaligenes endophyticus TaxID=1929088 RepID=A0ABT8ENB7_9BURK|nr:alanine racemase [Alcaligenes endophyticus]MCX5591318.1 alanine racemase [Alcaligenes endophyticus]MDN4122801.1 alanine racemase [Alcaligenes endophyticus]
MPRPILATISLPALEHNLHTVIQSLNSATALTGQARPRVWAVIKANAYGHGIAQAVRAFEQADGLAMLDVAEAVLCRELGWKHPIMLLEGFFEPSDLEIVARHDLTVVVHTFEQLHMLERWGGTVPIRIWLKLNTGMNRLGFSVPDYPLAFRQAQSLQAAGKVASIGKMAHFARADDDVHTTIEQIHCFIAVTAELPGPISLCNSAATLSPDLGAHMPAAAEQWVRPGICLYGSSPFAHIPATDFGLLPSMTLAADIISVRGVEAGQGIGYGYTFVADKPLRIGVVACGYADGYPRHAPSGTPIYVNGIRTRLLGRVSMDMLMVDLTPVPAAGVGSRAVLWGENGPSIDEVAAHSGTLGYELMCAVAPRVPRHIQDLKV